MQTRPSTSAERTLNHHVLLQSQTNELDTKMMGSVASARRQADALLAIIDSVRSPEQAAEELQLISDAAPTLPTALVRVSTVAYAWLDHRSQPPDTLFPCRC